MELRIGKETVTCGCCGEKCEVNVINGHITYPRICSKCVLDILKEWESKNDQNHEGLLEQEQR